MFLRIKAEGPGSDQLSYRIGNHPSRQLIRRESEALGRLWFSEYEEDRCQLAFHVRSNVPPIPNRLTDPELRFREWHRFPEWLDRFLEEIVRDPRPPAPEEATPDLSVVLGTLPRPVSTGSTLVDFLERADTTPTPDHSNPADHWLHLNTTEGDLSFSQLLRRLALVVPALIGGPAPDRTPDNYARLLDALSDTWFDMHPERDFIANRFLWLQESHIANDMNPDRIAFGEQVRSFRDLKNLFGEIGQTVTAALEQDYASDDTPEIWLINGGDGAMLEGLLQSFGEANYHLQEGHQSRLPAARQRYRWLTFQGAAEGRMTEDHFHWCPPGHRIEDMEDPDAIVFTPAAGELDPATLKERIHLLFSSHDTGHVFTWTPVQEDSVRAFNRADASDAREMNVDSWRSLWSQRAEREDFDSDWNRIREGEELDWIDSVLVGSFHREDYV